MRERYRPLFKHCKQENRMAFIPFFVLGYPDATTSLALILASIAAGADALELGLPFSDPIADGPVIQAASFQALQQGMCFEKALLLIQKIREQHETIPLGLLGYSNAVETYQDDFYKRLSIAGLDSILLADLPVHALAPYAHRAHQNKLAAITLATPACDEATLDQVATLGSGYTYVVTRKGVTGAGVQGQFDDAANLTLRLSLFDAPPPVFGFGIQSGEDILKAKAAGAAGVIMGSHLIQIYERERTISCIAERIREYKTYL